MNVGETITFLILCGMILVAYLIPTIVAVFGKHPAALGIAVLNLTLGWTGTVWIVTFI